METIQKKDFVACFVNTDKQPLAVIKLPHFSYIEDASGKMLFSQLHKLIYPHPDNPEYATVSVYSWEEVSINHRMHSVAKLAIDAVANIEGMKN